MVDDDLLRLVVVEREGAVQPVVLSPLGSLRQAGHTQVAQPTATLPAAAVIPLKVKSRGLSGENWKHPGKECAYKVSEERLLLLR